MATIMNTLQAQYLETPSGELLAIADEAVRGLLRLGYVQLCRVQAAPTHWIPINDVNVWSAGLLNSLVEWGVREGAWRSKESAKDIELTLTDEGAKALRT